MNSEEDTIAALKRTPFLEMRDLIIDGNCNVDTDEEYEAWLSKYGWTVDAITAEINKYLGRNAIF